MQEGRTYPCDLTDKEWEIIKPLIPVYKRGRKREVNMREVINGLLYMTRTGCQWDYIPKDYPKKSTLWYYFDKWTKDGTWKQFNDELRKQVRVMAGRDPDASAAIIDSQSVKSAQCRTEKGYDGGKKIGGRKRQILVDVLGLLLSVNIHAANKSDITGAKELFELNAEQYQYLSRIWADGGYQGDFKRWLKSNYDITLEIVKSIKYKGYVPKKYQKTKADKLQLNLFDIKDYTKTCNMNKADELRKFKIVKWRWIVERTFSWLINNRRLSKDYESHPKSGESFCYLAMTRLMLNRLTT
ncbi:IS5 family transposase [Patescibacteria group bacterium]|nr:IS5 family transposase [Patescibacteria group bacterium]